MDWVQTEDAEQNGLADYNIFLLDPWYCQTAMSSVILKNTLHHQLCIPLQFLQNAMK